MKRRLKISWCSNHPKSSSGYAQQSADIERKLVESGWDKDTLCMINNFGQAGYIDIDAYGIKHFPNMVHVAGSDAMLHHGNKFGADVVFGLFDLWVQNPQDLAQIPRFVPWVPIDYDPVPGPILQNLRFANRIIAMSKYGQHAMQENGFSSLYIPHHVDTKLFSPRNRMETKMKRGINPNQFVFGMVSANKDILPRKSFGHVLMAFKRFLEKYPESLLYIHTNPEQPGGYNIRQHSMQLGIANKILYPDLYKWSFDTPKEEMVDIFNTFDVLLSPSSTEGFCIPIIEAQACGIPAIVNNYTSMPELVIDTITGYVVKESPDCQHFMPIGSYMKFPSIDDLYQKMLRARGMKLDVMGKAARKYIVENYDLDMIWETKWIPLLDRLEKEVYPDLTEVT